MKFRWISIALVFAIFLIQSHAGEPFRVGIDVPEPKLVSKVEVPYPDFAKIGVLDGPVVVYILIDERGIVAEVNARFFNSAFLEPAISAVKQWRFSPTFVDGKAVPVTATVVVVFSNSSTPYTIDLGINK
jgi:hypothetical protein